MAPPRGEVLPGTLDLLPGASENNRKAQFYALTRPGHKQLLSETESRERRTALLARLLRGAEGA
jgi:PadR family transcriptional regulator PadR